MAKGLFVSLIITTLLAASTALEWYEQGHTAVLTPANFSQALSEPHRYKFVKFFTHSCRYCRLLKQVEDQLIEQQTWPFRIYDVDCELNYDMCVAAVQPTGFPFIGIYNMNGELEVKFSGYYPIEVMRDVFRNISARQTELLQREGIKVQEPQVINSQDSHQQREQASNPNKYASNANTQQQIEPRSQQSIQIGQQTTAVRTQTKGKEEDNWSSVSEGIKILMVLFGYWMFDKMIRPYLNQPQQDQSFKTKSIEIPLYRAKQQAKTNEAEGISQEGRLLLSDSI